MFIHCFMITDVGKQKRKKNQLQNLEAHEKTL